MNNATSSFGWMTESTRAINQTALEQARERQNQLTKPPGSLGRLEAIALQFAGWQGSIKPRLESICVRIFAADHGVCAQNVSAFPQIVTTQMIANFLSGGAAISVLCRQLGADFGIYNLGTAHPVPPLAGLHNFPIAAGTRDFSEQPAMTSTELARALEVGAAALPTGDVHLFIGGEMGIGNTTSASALFSALLDLPAKVTVGPGTGLDAQGMAHKAEVIERSLSLHNEALGDRATATRALAALQCLGGFEIAALVGAYIASAQRGVPVLVDGFITTAAALCAVQINPSAADWLLFAHRSAEPAHRLALEHLRAQPLLDLQMRLGEGSGAAVAVPLLQSALNLHNRMATFADAGVSDGHAV